MATATPGSWPLSIGVAGRVEALLPEAERVALHDALGFYARSTYYLEALAADEARRWSDDGTRALERAARKLAKGARS